MPALLSPLRALLRRLSSAFLAAACVVTAVLFGGLVHDSQTADASAAWLTPRPHVPAVLLVVGVVCMVVHGVGSRADE